MTDTLADRSERRVVKLAIEKAIPIGIKHANVIIALAELIADYGRYVLEYDDDREAQP